MRVSPDGTITTASFSYGGMAAWTISTPKTQTFLIGMRTSYFSLHNCAYFYTGKQFNYETLEGALEILGAEIDLPFDVPGGMPSYRKTLALSFLFKFWSAVSVDLDIPLEAESSLSGPVDDIVGLIHRQASSGRRDNSVRTISSSPEQHIESFLGPLRPRGCGEAGTSSLRIEARHRRSRICR